MGDLWHITVGTRKDYFRVAPRDPIFYISMGVGMRPWKDQAEMGEYCDKVTILCQNSVSKDSLV